MKRYMIFGGEAYYPCGGMLDFIKDFNSLMACKYYIRNRDYDWIHIFDTKEGRIIWERKEYGACSTVKWKELKNES